MNELDEAKQKYEALLANDGQYTSWQTQAPVGLSQFTGVAIPLKVKLEQGDVKIFASLPAQVMESPEALKNAITTLINAGIPVDIWRGNSWGNNQGGGNGGGYQNNNYRNNNNYGGGYQRQGGYQNNSYNNNNRGYGGGGYQKNYNQGGW